MADSPDSNGSVGPGLSCLPVDKVHLHKLPNFLIWRKIVSAAVPLQRSGVCSCPVCVLCVCSVVERELLYMLPFSEQCSADEAELVHFCYENILKKVGLCIKHGTHVLYARM